jgi:hypothetical protein
MLHRDLAGAEIILLKKQPRSIHLLRGFFGQNFPESRTMAPNALSRDAVRVT